MNRTEKALVILAAVIIGLSMYLSFQRISEVTATPPARQPISRVQVLELERPRFEWVMCTCPNGATIGLNNEDFLKVTMYMSGLEHEYNKCLKVP